jgi:hypothetical protein
MVSQQYIRIGEGGFRRWDLLSDRIGGRLRKVDASKRPSISSGVIYIGWLPLSCIKSPCGNPPG